MDKSQRHQAICDLVAKKVVSSQQELQKGLATGGIEVTQATLSRDLRELQIVKVQRGDSGFRYAAPLRSQQSAITKIQKSDNLLVIHTKTGMAAPMAYRIDELEIPGVLGTVAGEDTLMVVVAEKKKVH